MVYGGAKVAYESDDELLLLLTELRQSGIIIGRGLSLLGDAFGVASSVKWSISEVSW